MLPKSKTSGGIMRALVLSAAIAAACLGPASGQTIIEEWANVRLPTPPALQDVKLNPAETAILAMDFTTQTCTRERRPRCAASVAKVRKLIGKARAMGATIIYSVAVPNSTAADILTELAPAQGETVLPPLGPDKFVNSDLEKTLKDKGLRTVVALGTQAQTSVLHTGAAAALRGFKVVVPVDGMSSDDPFPEAYTAWHLATASRIGAQVTLTKLDAISY
jgi:nicotinamidase-related amidase